MRKSAFFFGYVGITALLLGAAFVHAAYERGNRAPELQAQAELVRNLELTDLCIFTEARYTRHPSQADLHSPFQDHPGSLEHFPSGSLLTPQRYSLERLNHVD
jgi:hypothetical protein